MNENLAEQINTIIDFSVTAFLYVYMICCFALVKLLIKQRGTFFQWCYALGALSFCGWVIWATPLKTLLIASIFVISGVPFYLYKRNQFKNKSEENACSLVAEGVA
jgi:APA family basic amino acid/polyamine antiporter